MVSHKHVFGSGQGRRELEPPIEALMPKMVLSGEAKGFRVHEFQPGMLKHGNVPIGYDESVKIEAGKRYSFPLSSCVGMIVFSADEMVSASHLVIGTDKRKEIPKTLNSIESLLTPGSHVLLIRGSTEVLHGVNLRQLQEEYVKDLQDYLSGRGIPRNNVHVHESRHYKDIAGKEKTAIFVTLLDKKHVEVDYMDFKKEKPLAREVITRTKS